MDNGIFAVYKPVGMTSHDVVNRVRTITHVMRVGHGGTLDPLAEGVLVIAVGRENTKLLDKYVKGEKEYAASIKLGFTSETDDSEGPIKKVSDNEPKLIEIQEKLKKFIGEISQTPSRYSAIKIKGKEAYKRIRKGETFEMEPRKVFIKRIEIISYDYPMLEIKVTCGTGVYIRSLARDIGDELQAGGYLTRLVRTRVGEFKVEDAIKLEDLQ
ncbi:MAG: tRNA pseudouridine(55) synthase TruB [Candidatus Levyibacteriota bacterium]